MAESMSWWNRIELDIHKRLAGDIACGYGYQFSEPVIRISTLPQSAGHASVA